MYNAPPATPLSELYARPRDLPDTFPVGRICAVPKCDTILSIYNGGVCCWPCGGHVSTKPVAEALVELMEQRS